MQYDLITIVASRRGVAALKHLLSELPSSFATPIACMIESSPGMLEQLQAVSRLPVRVAQRGLPVQKGHVYVSAPGESLMCLDDGTLGIVPCGPESSAMHPVDGFLESAAKIHGARLLALVLSGFHDDGLAGCECAKGLGGTVLVLDRATAEYWGVAEPIIQAGAMDRVLTIVEVAEALRACFTSQDLLRCAEIQVQIADVLEAAMRVAGTNMGHVARRSRHSDKMRIVVQRGVGLDFFERFDALPVDCEAAWCRAVRYRQRVLVPDVQDEPRHPARAFEPPPYRAELAVPLLVAQPRVEARGAITALYAYTREAPVDSSYLDDLARQAAALISGMPLA